MMSWAEIKKAINTDFTEPLNYLAWINDLATFGEDGYAYNSESIINELGSKSKNALKNTISATIITNKVFQYNTAVGGYFANVTNDATGSFDGLSSIEDVVGDVNAMTVVANSETAMTVVINSETACTAIRDSEIAITVLDNSNPILVPQMTSNTEPSGIASASSIASETLSAWKAFNRTNINVNDRWVSLSGSNTNQWIEYQFNTPVWLYKIEYEGREDVLDQTFKNSKMQYFDGSNWVDTVSFQPQQTIQKQTFGVSAASGRHTKWRVFVADVWGGVAAGAGRLQFYGK